MVKISLSEKIKTFYDRSSPVWEQVWGEHMHHGYYRQSATPLRSDPREAQRVLIERILEWARVDSPQSILDVGCGIGGSSLYLAAKYRAEATGITLSPVQRDRAMARATAAGLCEHAHFHVADAMDMPFPSNQFDLVWSLESGEHMPDKQQFLAECHRVLRPGGRLILATWCHRDETPPQLPLTRKEQELLSSLYELYHLPYIVSLTDYILMAQQLPFSSLETADWSTEVAPFWQDVFQSMFDPKALWGLLHAGWQTLAGARAIPLMINGYRSGLICYNLLTGLKQ